MADAQPLVLIIDDAMPIRVLLRAGLAKAGYRTVEATDGRQGLEQFIAHKPDLVLMDVNMPVMDGFQCCRALREHDAGHLTPVIMLTGSDDLESINHAFDAGASDFIAKPINLPLLTQRIRYALRDAERELTLRRVQQQHDSARMLAGLVYWTYDIPTDAERGGHAHIHCRELIVSVSGAFTVTLDDGSQRQQYLLSKPYEGLLVDTRIWRTLENFSSGAVCLVLAEDPFDESDYIYDYSDFLRYKNKNIDSPTSNPSENV